MNPEEISINEIKKPSDLAKFIDHTLLKPEAKASDIEQVCKEAINYNFWSVCINSYYVSLAKNLLSQSNVKICTVVGFPLGASLSAIKANEASLAIEKGAQEIDMVLNIGALKSRDFEFVEKDISLVVRAAHPSLVKVILETALLTNDEKQLACKLAVNAGAQFVKTSTGFSSAGATEADIVLMRKVVGESLGVKASGGVRTFEDALKMVNAGANRIGASSSVAIVTSSENLGDIPKTNPKNNRNDY